MTDQDRAGPLPGYYPSPWPVECGGNRRQKAVAGGLNARGNKARAICRYDDRWHVMAIRRGRARSMSAARCLPGTGQSLMVGCKSWT